jgi:acetamidase/formamidase
MRERRRFESGVAAAARAAQPDAQPGADAVAPGLDDAVKQPLRDMIKLICEISGLSPQDAYTLCSIAADLRVTQTVDGNKGIHCVLAKTKLPARR